MKILSMDFAVSDGGYNVAICLLENEGESKIKHIEASKTGDKLEDIAQIIVAECRVLNCDYVIIDSCGLGIVISEVLKKALGNKVKEYKTYSKEETKLVTLLDKSGLLKQVGLDLKLEQRGGEVRLDRTKYQEFEYLMVKSIGMANKLLNEIESESKKIKSKEIVLNEIDGILKRLMEKERFKLSMIRTLEDEVNYYEQVERFDLSGRCKKELKNINDENKFIYNLILDVEKIKHMLDEV